MNPALLDRDLLLLDRDLLLFGGDLDWQRKKSPEYFKDIPVSVLVELIELNLLNPNSRQNNSPTAEEFMTFMKKYPGFTAHGYATSPLRNHRIVIEGITYRGVYDKEVMQAFALLCRKADVFESDDNYLYCWYD